MWVIVVLAFLLWNFETFDLFSIVDIRDPAHATRRISLLKSDLFKIFLPLFFSVVSVWTISFWQNFAKPFLVVSSLGAVVGIFLIFVTLNSACEGLCFGHGLFIFFGLLALSFIALSFPFVVLLFHRLKSPTFIRVTSAGLLIIISIVGIIFLEISLRSFNRAGEQNLAHKLTEWSKISLFAPAYVPTGLRQIDEKSPYRINKEFFYEQYYSSIQNTFDHAQIVQSVARKSFEGYYDEYHRKHENKTWEVEKWKEEEISVNNVKALVWTAKRDQQDQLVEVFFIKDGTELHIRVRCIEICKDARKEAIAIVESLKPKNKSSDLQPSL